MLRILPERPPAELDGGEPLLAERRDGLGHLLGRVRHQPRRVGADALVADGAEQLADRLARRLALEVPERDVEAADRVDRDAAPADVVDAAVHLVPEPLDVVRVLAEQELAQAVRDRVRARGVDERGDGLGRRVDLADAGEPLVGVDQDDEVVLAAVGDALVDSGLPQDDGLDIGDLQAVAPWTMPGGPKVRLSIITRLSTILASGRLAEWDRCPRTTSARPSPRGSTRDTRTRPTPASSIPSLRSWWSSPGDGDALELGIGTGRIALPLAERGVRVHGIDLSEAMVARLRAKPGAEQIGVTVGDFAVDLGRRSGSRSCTSSPTRS